MLDDEHARIRVGRRPTAATTPVSPHPEPNRTRAPSSPPTMRRSRRDARRCGSPHSTVSLGGVARRLVAVAHAPDSGRVRRGDGRLTSAIDPNDAGPQDACGVFGVWAPGEDVGKLTYYGLYALQHRGQESAGIAVSNGRQILVYKDMGLVSQVFDEATLESLKGHVAVGHARYSTTGASTWHNAQPTFRPTATGSIALAHNGNLTNTHELADRVEGLANAMGE